MIELRESESELLLTVPFHLKDRAKGIDGRRWDADRRCWVYPKHPRIYDAIIAEFGDDLTNVEATRPPDVIRGPAPSILAVPTRDGGAIGLAPQLGSGRNVDLADLASENVALKGQVEEILKSLGALAQSQSGEKNSEISRLQHRLRGSEIEIADLRSKLREAQTEAADRLAEVNSLRTANRDLAAELTANRQQLAGAPELVDRLAALAIEASAGSRQFRAILQTSRKDASRYPIDFAVALERHLRSMLKTIGGVDPVSWTPEDVDRSSRWERGVRSDIHRSCSSN